MFRLAREEDPRKKPSVTNDMPTGRRIAIHPYGYVDFSPKTYTRKNLLLQAVTSRAIFLKL